ncbi:helix-turn-helix domain-containing protein [Streptomyces sp. K1PN6]|uniref:Helix-turn-helix domain-containing protein n=1 Tax=Streptomyces acidicola TaxID=2596892 RepID=A0A5N8WVG5_9ACTN|nr:helix-turn-helix domain-containing protein [Streptomyces acidicola]
MSPSRVPPRDCAQSPSTRRRSTPRKPPDGRSELVHEWADMAGHPNAPLTREGRRRSCERVDAGRSVAHIAAEAGISRRCLAKWYARWRAHGESGLLDHSSRPATSPVRTTEDIADLVEALRRDPSTGLPASLPCSRREPSTSPYDTSLPWPGTRAPHTASTTGAACPPRWSRSSMQRTKPSA